MVPTVTLRASPTRPSSPLDRVQLGNDRSLQTPAACAVFMAMNTWVGIDEMGELTPPAGALALRRG